MTTIIGIFDNPLAVEKTVNRLNKKGLSPEVFDPNLELEEAIGAGGESVLLADAVGVSLHADIDSYDGEYDSDHFCSSLADLQVPDVAIQYYETLFDRGEIFIAVETEEHFVDEVMNLMRTTGASLIGRHN